MSMVYDPEDIDEMAKEYLKAVDNLTVATERKLRLENEELKQKITGEARMLERIDSIKNYVDLKLKSATSLEELKEELVEVGNMTTTGKNKPKVRRQAAPPICAECGKLKDKVFKDYRGRGLCIQCITNA